MINDNANGKWKTKQACREGRRKVATAEAMASGMPRCGATLEPVFTRHASAGCGDASHPATGRDMGSLTESSPRRPS
jgi:hypothetical protein